MSSFAADDAMMSSRAEMSAKTATLRTWKSITVHLCLGPKLSTKQLYRTSSLTTSRLATLTTDVPWKSNLKRTYAVGCKHRYNINITILLCIYLWLQYPLQADLASDNMAYVSCKSRYQAMDKNCVNISIRIYLRALNRPIAHGGAIGASATLYVHMWASFC